MEINTIEVGQRLKTFINAKSLSINKFGAKIGTSATQISAMISGSKFGIDKLIGITNSFPELSLEWLLSGEGQMEKFSETQGISQSGTNNFVGNKNKQKNISGDLASIDAGQFANVIELQQQLKTCQQEKDALSRELVDTQKEMIEILKGRK